ncbi:MAG: DegV family protein [Oscillospiraceae bacterium]|nr:DegV family protein [Oscillospiraceae bacterium]
MLVLFTDTDTDITPSEAREFGYRLISMPYSVDGKTTYPYVDFDVFDAHAFYDMLRAGALPNTSAISVEQYRNYFEPVFAEGNDILYVHFSRAMTATFDAMDRAVAELKTRYPDRAFYEIDTKGITIGSLNIVKEIGDQYRAGRTAEEMLAWARDEVDRFAVYFFADDLRFFKHSGRVSGLAGTMGTLLGIRPIIHMNSEGKMVSVGKEKGRAKAMERLVAYVEELGDHVADHRVIVGHSDSREIAEEVIALLRRRFGEGLRIELVDVNPTAGSHCGPNGVGISFHAVHR